MGEPEHQVREKDVLNSLPEIGNSAPINTITPSKAATDLKDKIMARMNTKQLDISYVEYLKNMGAHKIS